jgi:hypothetical protein
MANLDFSDLQQNIVHALWMFDHPGVDTDSDGYFGQFTVCEAVRYYCGGCFGHLVLEFEIYL